MEISLSGRSAIVTGGSKGIGLAVATRFAQSGADVAIVARGKESLDEAVAAIKELTVPSDVRAILAYEEAHKDRQGVVSAAQTRVAAIAQEVVGIG